MAKKRLWQAVHHCVAHPLYFLSGFSRWSELLHDWTDSKIA